MNGSRRGLAQVIGIGSVVLCLAGWLPAAAQQHNDTIVVSPEETKTLIDSVVVHTPKNPVDNDTVTGSSVGSESLEHVRARVDSVVLRSVPDSVIAGWKKDKDFAYANDPAYWRKEVPEIHSNGFLLYFVYFLLGAILLFAIIRIVAENRLFYRSPAKAIAVPEETVSPLEEDLDQQLQKALAAKDHRMSVRYLYLKALRLLSERELIRYHIQATNREYVRQLSGSALGDPFRFLTGAYERVWYGEFSLSDGQFEKLYPYFQNFYKSIGQS